MDVAGWIDVTVSRFALKVSCQHLLTCRYFFLGLCLEGV